MMIDRISLCVKHMEASQRFYEKTLSPLGIYPVHSISNYRAVGFGKDGKATFWIVSGDASSVPVHVAFIAESKSAVEEFRKVAHEISKEIDPVLLEEKHSIPNYISSFAIDPDGNSIEAVFRGA